MLERLQKIISRAGIASRRHAEDLIRSGQVRVNGVVVTELGAKADPEHDRVEAAGKVAQPSEVRVYLLMNKPPEVVATLADPEGRPTLRNFLVGVSERVFPVGRLDYAAGGAIFLTNDGDLASRMLKASVALPQTYWVKVKGRLNEAQMKSLAQILRGKVFPLRAPHAAGKNPPNPWYEAQFSGARRDLLRQNLLAIGHPVEKLKRMKLASLDADTVPEGHYRQLDAAEVAKLVRAVDLALAQPKPLLPPARSNRPWRPRRVMVGPESHSESAATSDSRTNFRPKSGFNSKPSFKSFPNFKSKSDSRSPSDFKPKSDFRPKSDSTPESGFRSKADFRPKSDFHHKSGFKPKSDFRSKSDFRPKSDFKHKSGFKPKSDFRPKSDFKSKPGFKPKSDFRTKSDFEPRSDFRPKSDFKHKSGFKPKSDFRPKSDFKSKPGFKPKSDFRTKSDFEPRSDFRSKSDFRPKSDFKHKSGFKPKSDFRPKSNFRSKSGFKPKPNFKSRPPHR
jgi:23S rRNA pseudouridine2605 synthase